MGVDFSRYPLVYCEVCGDTTKMQITELTGKEPFIADALSLKCGACNYVIASLHAPTETSEDAVAIRQTYTYAVLLGAMIFVIGLAGGTLGFWIMFYLRH